MLKHFLQSWKNISISKKLYIVVGTMALLILIELLTLRFAMDSLSAVRAFVGGEGLWTKAQKQAIYNLQNYLRTKDIKDYHAFEKALSVNDGDHLARIELIKPNPDMAIVHKGFLAGQIHPDDIDPMVRLLRRFSTVSYIAMAINAWTEGDLLIAELKTIGLKQYELISIGKLDSAAIRKITAEMYALNIKLDIVTANFSHVLGEGSRWMENLVLMILFSLVLTVETVGLTLTLFTSRAISGGLTNLINVANQIGIGRFNQRLDVTSEDEIGQLTVAVNNMGSLLQKSYSDLMKSQKELEDKINLRTVDLAKTALENEILYNQAISAVKMRDEFMSIASHELRTPITGLLLHLQMLERMVKKNKKNDETNELEEFVHRGVNLSRRLANLQDTLMDLTRISLGKIELKKESVDLVMLIKDVVTQLEADTAKSGSSIKVVSDTSLLGHVDPIRMSQVITNLVNNAIKYGQGSAIEIMVQNESGFVHISVTDHGPGIPDDKQEKIFERFERASDDISVSGLGLGLYISQQIVHAHSGKITLESKLMYGTSFKVSIPQLITNMDYQVR